jgi:hypothetical protein
MVSIPNVGIGVRIARIKYGYERERERERDGATCTFNAHIIYCQTTLGHVEVQGAATIDIQVAYC